MTIRDLALADIPPCARLFTDVFSNPPWSEHWTETSALRRLDDCARTPHFLGLLVEDERGLCGFAFGYSQYYLDEQHYYLLELCIDTARQRQGVGGALLTALKGKAIESGISRLYTLTARDTPAQDFYAKHGFYVSPKMIMMAHRL
ncbi:GNAT family N-acetyltransferase [Rariglobus hedericola]|uniref:GNAT family N-acetyltransferase n=1 Tax=Rariglobus hedericola TaxID=2597822 RepID=A0A556QRI8_9BACT|nr:GNAT family N-acetyltransferase [Rariglobus hedericola]TSJ79239.1 GNAT family N-acetyltransferase [Rariglobus hedericola]